MTTLDLRTYFENEIDGNSATVHDSAGLACHMSFYTPLGKALAERLGKSEGLGNVRAAVTEES